MLKKLAASIGYYSAACGADILFLEAMLSRQAEVNIVLPFAQEEFRKTSVDLVPGAHWGERFEKVMHRPTRQVVACEHRSSGHPVAYDYANLLQDGLAVLPHIGGVLRVGLAGDHLRTITEKGKDKEDFFNGLKSKGVTVKDIAIGEPTLEDVFISLAR